MAVELLLSCIVALLGTAFAAVIGARRAATSVLVYATALGVCTVALGTAAWTLVADAGLVETLDLPIGLPWLGAHFRLDPLAAAFLLVVNLGAATASSFPRFSPE